MLASTLLVTVLAASSSVQALSQQYLDGLFRARPHLAAYMGVHKHDGRLMDLDPPAITQRIRELNALAAQVKALDLGKLPADARADARILADGIALELLYLTDIRDWTWDARLDDSFPFYDPREYVASRLGELVHGTFAPEGQRARSVAAQLEALPHHLSMKQSSLVTPEPVRLAQAVKDNAGRITFFNTELKAFTAKYPDAEKARLAAVKALESYQSFLSSFPAAKATRDWRLGKELYDRKFPLALQTDMTPAQLEKAAREVFERERGQLYALARKLAAEVWPKEPPPPENPPRADQAQLIRRVQEEISKNHPKPDELVQAHADKLASLRTFITQKKLLKLPPADTLRVKPEPEYKRGAVGAEYLAPGMLDTSSKWHGTFYVDPVDPGWPPEKVESYLRANDWYAVTLTSAHEAYPGHHTQTWYARQHPNALRSTLWSGTFAEGWAVYGTRLLIKEGLGEKENARYALREARNGMVVAANAILDIRLQRREMSDEEALRFMEEEGFQEEALAERKLLRAKLDSTQLCQYFLGWNEVEALERDVKARGKFDQRAFNQELIGHGTVPVKILRAFFGLEGAGRSAAPGSSPGH
ncbi:MAG TPA: DUF885 domain-containing protein [Myxococcaceae bacterium]|nr:DUF885 domain-containing protein [Myxococcaceae bacterium]